MLLFIALFARYTVLDSIFFFKVVFLSLHSFVLMFAVLSLAVFVIRDRWEITCLSLHCHHQNDSCIRIGSDESLFNVL